MSSGPDLDVIKIGLEVISIGVTAAVAWLGLTIRNVVADIKLRQAEAKETLLAGQNKVKEDLTQTLTDQKLAIAVHEVLDNERFKGVQNAIADVGNDIKELKDLIQRRPGS